MRRQEKEVCAIPGARKARKERETRGRIAKEDQTSQQRIASEAGKEWQRIKGDEAQRGRYETFIQFSNEYRVWRLMHERGGEITTPKYAEFSDAFLPVYKEWSEMTGKERQRYKSLTHFVAKLPAWRSMDEETKAQYGHSYKDFRLESLIFDASPD